MSLNLIATSAFGLEAVVVRELAALGYDANVARPGRIAFAGGVEAVCRANLWLRSADRVLVELAAFPAEDFDALFDTVRSLPWEEWMAADAAIPVRGRSLKSQLSSVPACQRTVKKAIVERLLSAGGVKRRVVILQRKTGQPVQFEVTEQALRSIAQWIDAKRLNSDDWLFPSRMKRGVVLSREEQAVLHAEIQQTGEFLANLTRHP